MLPLSEPAHLIRPLHRFQTAQGSEDIKDSSGRVIAKALDPVDAEVITAAVNSEVDIEAFAGRLYELQAAIQHRSVPPWSEIVGSLEHAEQIAAVTLVLDEFGIQGRTAKQRQAG